MSSSPTAVPLALDDEARRELARELLREYAAELKVDLCFQDFEGELASMERIYGPPGGSFLLLRAGESVAGCVALREMGEGRCEMKRLYVRPPFRRRGLGRLGAEAIVGRARALGYRSMRLDTLASLRAATSLYRSLGFLEISPYYHNPLEGVIYMELEL